MNRYNFANAVTTGLSAIGAVGTYAFRPLKEARIRRGKIFESTRKDLGLDTLRDEIDANNLLGELDEDDTKVAKGLVDDHESIYNEKLLKKYIDKYGEEKGAQIFRDEAEKDVKEIKDAVGLTDFYDKLFKNISASAKQTSETQKSMDDYLRNKYDAAAKFLKGPNDEDFIKYLTRNYDFSEWMKEEDQ